jgi:uncharacterized membrane protein YhfC
MIITFPIAILFELFFPAALAFWAVRHFKTSWKLVGIGALIFIASQVVHIPLLYGLTYLFNQQILPVPADANGKLLLNATVLGLMAGLCEETARWAGFKLLKEKFQNWKSAITLGIGHGGIESILLAGIPVLLTFISMLAVRGMDPSNPQYSQLATYWSQPWHLPLAGAVERLTAIIMQITLSVLVAQVFIRRSGWFYLLAVLWHAILDFLAVLLAGLKLGVWQLEGVFFLTVFVNVAILFLLRPKGEQPQDSQPAGASASAQNEG